MKLYKYKSYEDYQNYQIKANKLKIHNSYVDPNSLFYLLKRVHPNYVGGFYHIFLK